MKSASARATLGSAALLSLLLLAGCQKEEAPKQAAPAPKVGVVTLEVQPFTLTSELPGRTAAFRVAEVRPQVDGIVQKRLFAEGSEVKAGQQLYQIDPATYQATLLRQVETHGVAADDMGDPLDGRRMQVALTI